MKRQNKSLVGWITVAGLMASFGVGICAEQKAEARVSTVGEVFVEKGSTVTIVVEPGDLETLLKKNHDPEHKLPLNFQWRKNNVSIPGATKDRLTLSEVTTNHVGSYTLLLTGAAEAETAPVHVSVYININGSTGRKLWESVGKFTIQNNTLNCAPGKTFGRYKTYTPFPSSTFPDGGESLLTIETCFPENGGSLDTAIVIKDNTLQMNVITCKDGANPGCGSNGNLAKATITRSGGMTYRATIHLRTMGGLEQVAWSYLFHDPAP